MVENAKRDVSELGSESVTSNYRVAELLNAKCGRGGLVYIFDSGMEWTMEIKLIYTPIFPPYNH